MEPPMFEPEATLCILCLFLLRVSELNAGPSEESIESQANEVWPNELRQHVKAHIAAVLNSTFHVLFVSCGLQLS